MALVEFLNLIQQKEQNMARTSIGRVLRRLCILIVLVAGVFIFAGTDSGYAVAQECSTCDFNYWNCWTPCDAMNSIDDPLSEIIACFHACAETLSTCSVGCTPSGMPYRPSCPDSGGCAEFGSNCETNCTAIQNVCLAGCEPGPNYNSCWNLCQNDLNICRGFCQAEYYDCLACDD